MTLRIGPFAGFGHEECGDDLGICGSGNGFHAGAGADSGIGLVRRPLHLADQQTLPVH